MLGDKLGRKESWLGKGRSQGEADLALMLHCPPQVLDVGRGRASILPPYRLTTEGGTVNSKAFPFSELKDAVLGQSKGTPEK